MSESYQSNRGDSERRPEVRIGDRDREQAVAHLGRAFAEGRLDLAEYDERVALAYSAKTASDLLHLTGDLPEASVEPGTSPALPTKGPNQAAGSGTHVAPRDPGWLRPVWAAYIGAVAINLVVWFLIGLGNGADFPYFWPMWVAGPWGVLLLMRTIAAKSAPRSGR